VSVGGFRALGALCVCVLALGAGTALAASAEDPLSAPALGKIRLKSQAALVVDLDTGETLVAKNENDVVPVASLTKLMTGLVVLESKAPLDEMLEITDEDRYPAKRTPSKLTVGTRLTRGELLLLALMASENRAAMALSRHYPGGRVAFIARMNSMASEIGMQSTHFDDPAGLSDASVSSARDLHLLLRAASAEPLIGMYSTQRETVVRVQRRNLRFYNSNRLVRFRGHWDIALQKTGYTNEAGRCLVMQTRVAGRRLAMIFLDSFGKLTRYGDASRVRERIESEQRKRGRITTAASP
jgi:D-alanyl-D-alanine endopeptidase (penicillin-binding protein 7)